jgi:hypothetical protein
MEARTERVLDGLGSSKVVSGDRVGARLQRGRGEAESLVRGLFKPQSRKP